MIEDPLIGAALLGTNRMTALPPAPDPALEITWQSINLENPAAAMLHALALTRALLRAGTRSTEGALVQEPAAKESQPDLPPVVVEAGLRMLKGEFPDVLPEWLRLTKGSGGVLPGRALPEFLQAATRNQAYRPAVRGLTGERGRWIARKHPEFAWVLADSLVADEAWDEGLPEERLAWLRQIRRSDPARAAAAITSQWNGEDAAFREAVTRLIAQNPHACDEVWLETLALKERRQETREAAVTALMLIPEAAFRERALARAGRHVKMERKLLKKVVTLDPPAAFETGWAADGIKEKAPQGTGEKAWWSRQIIAQVPLPLWPVLLGVKADSLFSIAVEKDWREPLVSGWIDAALRWPGDAMAGQFVSFLAALDPWPAGSSKVMILTQLLSALTPEGRHQALDQLATTVPVVELLELLVRCAEPPPTGMGQKALTVLKKAIVVVPPLFQRPQARALALCIPADEIGNWVTHLANRSDLSFAAEEFAHVLEFRLSILHHFSSTQS